jgi:hypothetical protein
MNVDGTKVSFGGKSVDRGELLASYAAVLRAVRDARPGADLALRTADLEVLATAVGADGHDVEARIRSLLGCTAAEAKRVHRELVKRRLLRPVAMLAVGSAIVWGPAAAASGDRPTLGEFQERPTELLDPSPALPGIPTAPTVISELTTTVPPAPDVEELAATPPVEASGSTLPAEVLPGEEPSLNGPVTSSTTAAPTATPAPSMVAPPDVGIPDGETPTVIIAS